MLLRTSITAAGGLLLALLLVGCATTRPLPDMPQLPAPVGDPVIHVTPLQYDGKTPNVVIDSRLEERNLATQVKVFNIFTVRYAAEFPSLSLQFVDTLNTAPELWYNCELADRRSFLSLLPTDPKREDWLLVIDTLAFAPLRQGFIKSLGRALFLVNEELPSYAVTLSARLINLDGNQPVTSFRIVQLDNPDKYSSVFEDRLAYTIKETAATLIDYLRRWRQR